MKIPELTPMQESILKEVGSVGTAHAATALARMTGRRISVMPTEMLVVPLRRAYELFAAIPELQVGVYSRMLEGFSACIVFFIPKGQSYRLVDLLAGRAEGETTVLGDMEQSTLRETGNIICASYVNAISEMTGLTIKLTTPKIIFDHHGQVLETILERLFPSETVAIMIENQFAMAGQVVNGYFLFVPRAEDLGRLLSLMEARVR